MNLDQLVLELGDFNLLYTIPALVSLFPLQIGIARCEDFLKVEAKIISPYTLARAANIKTRLS